MDFLTLLIIYCVIFVVGVLCMLYRDSPLLNTGPLGTVKHFFIESLSRVIPLSIQNGASSLCNYLLFQRTCVFQLIFVILCILGHAVWVIDMLPILYRHYPNYNHTFWPLVFIFVNYFCWHKAWTDDPAVINPKNVGNYAKVYDHDGVFYVKGNLCSTCEFQKPARSKHCSICNRCVHRFDHHCIWTNNCVGGLNHRYFILFMATLIAVFIQGIYVGGGCVLDYAHDIRLFNSSYLDDDNKIKPVTVSVAFQHLFMALPRLVFLVIALVVLVILVGIFFAHHLYLLFTNQTTNERHKLQALVYDQYSEYKNEDCDYYNNSKHQKPSRLKHAQSKPAQVNYSNYRPFSRGIFNNVTEVFFPHNFIKARLKQS